MDHHGAGPPMKTREGEKERERESERERRKRERREAHPSEEEAWSWAVTIVQKYKAHVGPLDRRTEQILNPSGPLRPMLDDFVATKVMHPVLRFEVSFFRFVPLSDRPAEAEHVFLKDIPKT